MKKIKVLIADDHAVVRTGLATILNTETDIEVVGLAKNGIEAVETALAAKPDVVIMDIRMPVMDGAEATRELREKLPDTKVLVLTSFGEADGVALALKSGAAGAITKTAEDAELVTVIRNIASGGKYISLDIEKLLAESPPVPKLTPRQHEILAYMTKGLTNVEIAKILSIRKDTVEEHVNLLLAKLYASNRTEAVAIALRKQLI
ncbi:MAG: response regulator transcription factor [Lentisphaerae bacterium]|nr:response regulator transcription factor [Lentisphaerota bacterium]MBR3823279.1 response regulator transcription factor [Kiritimatiellia bacterium]